jgi:DNA replication protein DnaC
LAEILITRYEHFIENKSITHITTNLSASEIEKLYGKRLRSRMRNMFNVISFDTNSKDKR